MFVEGGFSISNESDRLSILRVTEAFTISDSKYVINCVKAWGYLLSSV